MPSYVPDRRPIKTQVRTRLARQICVKWPSPNLASKSIIPKSPQHLFQVRSCPSPSLLPVDSCALPVALPVWRGCPESPTFAGRELQLSNKQVSSKGPSAPEVAPAQSREFEARTPLLEQMELPTNTVEEGASTMEGLPQGDGMSKRA